MMNKLGYDLAITGNHEFDFGFEVLDDRSEELECGYTCANFCVLGGEPVFEPWRILEAGDLKIGFIGVVVSEPLDLPSELVTRGDKERYVDPEMKSFLDDIVASYADIMERKIGEVPFDMLVRDADENDFSRWQENSLCDLVTDAYRTIGNTEIGFLNAGSVRNSLPAGEITYNSAVNVLPYSNEIMTAEVTGQTLLDALEFGVMNVPIKSARFPRGFRDDIYSQ